MPSHVRGPPRRRYVSTIREDDLYTLISRDWTDLGARPPDVADIGWLYAHRLYTVVLPQSGGFA